MRSEEDPARPAPHERIRVRVDAAVADLVPGFLQNRAADVEHMRQALAAADFETVRRLGHNMCGNGGAYGFREISELGRRLEDAAARRDAAEALRRVEELALHLRRVEVVPG